MKRYLTIDGGTTNTRLYLVEDRNIVAREKLGVGARDGKAAITAALQQAIPNLLAENGIKEEALSAIIASGMITSENGLYPLEHLTAPAGICELHDGMKRKIFPEICKTPFHFIPGVKILGKSAMETDMMRGEETELMGLSDRLDPDALYVLPGSHSKLISVDGKGRITKSETSLTGELLSAVLCGTILKDSVGFCEEEPDEKAIFAGYEDCLKNGLNRTLFQVRIRKNLFGEKTSDCYGYLLGALLCGEVGQILRSGKETIVLGGQKQLRKATALLLKRYTKKEIVPLSDSVVESATAMGAVAIFEAEGR